MELPPAHLFAAVAVSLCLQAEVLPIRYYTSADGLAADHVDCIVPDSREFIWFCTQSGVRVGIAQAHDSQTSPVTDLRMRLAFQNRAHNLGGGRTDGFGPVDQPRGGPLQMRLVALGHMLAHSGVDFETATLNGHLLSRRAPSVPIGSRTS